MADSSIEKAIKYLDKELVAPLRQMAMARKLIGKTTTIPDGKFEITFDQVTEMGDGTITFGLPDSSVDRDDIATTARNIKLVVPHKGYKIAKQKLDSFASEGKSMDTAAMESAMQVTMVQEEAYLMTSWAPDGSTDVKLGFYNAANNTISGSATSTYGNSVANVEAALDKLLEDNINGVNFNYVMARANYLELLGSLSTTGLKEMPQVEEMLNSTAPGAAKGGVSWHPNLAANTGILIPVDPVGMYFDLVMGSDMRNVIGTDSKMGDLSDYYAIVYEALTLRYKQVDSSGLTKAFCTTTGL